METKQDLLFTLDKSVPKAKGKGFVNTDLRASFCDEVLTLEFAYPIDQVRITLTHLNSGKATFESCSYLGSISLNLEHTGPYRVQVQTRMWCVVAEFHH